ncbi:sugar ABC transporter ATP-binding protein [Desulfotignum balticum]|uniref:sugar ABC transporter ATP-binding protein n=1 Tax=Desulfotignum balticum TaxID=115781 RepID=UPI000414620A|nr:sugar ABC transporter ATP-binding protein [Desulfotignum balticum]
MYQTTEPMLDRTKKVLLKLKNICKLYPGTVALNKVNVNIKAGECHGIIGKNGAGKTTLVKIISGVIPPSTGEIFIDGKLCHNLTRRQAKKLGISIVTQEPQIIPEFTVAENLLFPDYHCMFGKQISWNKIYKIAEKALLDAKFPMQLDATGADLSVSEQQLLLVIKAFFVDQNNIVILDEVTSALSQKDQEYLFELIDQQKQQGKAIILISHRMSEIIRMCDSITVLRDSVIVVSKSKGKMDVNALSKLIIGDNYVAETPDENKKESKVYTKPKSLLNINNLTVAGKFNKINLALNQGEVVGLAGLRGSGRTDLMKTIGGANWRDAGEILLNGTPINFRTPKDAFRVGVAYLPEDRDGEGLVEILSVKDNISLSSLMKFTNKSIIDTHKESSTAQKFIDFLDIKVSTQLQQVQTLSGGNRQKVVIARLMAAEPTVYLLDEPTKGIDIMAKNFILNIIRNDLSKAGGVLMTSPSVEDLMLVCDRIIVLYDGSIVHEFNRNQFNPNQIYLAIQGVNVRPESKAVKEG